MEPSSQARARDRSSESRWCVQSLHGSPCGDGAEVTLLCVMIGFTAAVTTRARGEQTAVVPRRVHGRGTADPLRGKGRRDHGVPYRVFVHGSRARKARERRADTRPEQLAHVRASCPSSTRDSLPRHGGNASPTYCVSATEILGPYSEELALSGSEPDFSHVPRDWLHRSRERDEAAGRRVRWSNFAGEACRVSSPSEWSLDV
jgi:hypothetical protein